MNTWKVILATMVIFGAGVVTGGLLVRSTIFRLPQLQHPTPAPHPAQPTYAGVMRLEFLRRMEHELDVTPEQRAKLDKILKESQERSKQIMEPVADDLRGELQRTRREFIEALTPPQRARFEEKARQQQLHPHEPKRPSPGRETNSAVAPATNATP